ncbi:MAG TPA: site-specific integrase, partial [Anaerolineaceae bacterium]
MKTAVVEHATLQIFSDSIPNIINQFLVERRSRGLSKASVWFYTRYLDTFWKYLDGIGAINIEEATPDVIRRYLLTLESQGHNPGGVHGHYRCVRALLNWWEEETDGDY